MSSEKNEQLKFVHFYIRACYSANNIVARRPVAALYYSTMMVPIYNPVLPKLKANSLDLSEAQGECCAAHGKFDWGVGYLGYTEFRIDADLHRIRNPLVDIPKETLRQEVDTFAATYQLQDILPELWKGSLAAQSPALFETIPELDDSDKALLRHEIEHRWKQPKALYFAIVLSSIAAAIQGWDQTGSNGANLSFPDVFGIDEGPDGPCAQKGTCARNQWLVGLINSMPYFTIFLLSVCDALSYSKSLR